MRMCVGLGTQLLVLILTSNIFPYNLDINDIQDVSSDMNNIHTLENTENIQNSSGTRCFQPF